MIKVQLKGKCKISKKDKINWSLIFGRPTMCRERKRKKKIREEEEKRTEEEEQKRYI